MPGYQFQGVNDNPVIGISGTKHNDQEVRYALKRCFSV